MPPDRISPASRSKSSSTSSSTTEDYSGKNTIVNNNVFGGDDLVGGEIPLNHGNFPSFDLAAVINEGAGAPSAQSGRGRASDGGGNALRRRRHQSVHAVIREAKKEGKKKGLLDYYRTIAMLGILAIGEQTQF